MLKNRKRTIITFLGIMLMVMMMTAVFVGKDTFMDYMINMAALHKGSWHFQVYGLDSEKAEEIRGLDSVEKLEVSRDYGYTLFERSAKPDTTPFLEVKAYSGDIYEWMNIRVVEGRYPENAGEIMISRRMIDDGSDIGIGDTINAEFFERYIHALGEEDGGEIVFPFQNMFTVKHGKTEKAPAHFPYYGNDEEMEEIHEYSGYKCTYTVVGIMEPPYFEYSGAAGYVAICGGTSVIGEGETVNAVGKVDLGNRGEPIDISLYRIMGADGKLTVNDYILSFAGKGSDGTFNRVAVFFQTFFMVLIIAASAVLIYNVFNISFRERTGYLGLLSSVGATGSQKRWSVYYEIFLILAAALPLGILAGLGLVWGGMTMLVPHVQDLMVLTNFNTPMTAAALASFRVVVNPLNILSIVLFSIAAVWVSALLPAGRIGKTGAISSIRGNESTGEKKYRFSRLMNAASENMLKKGRCLSLLSDASVRRSRFLSKGIVRSMVIFLSLTLIVAFGVRTITDIVDKKANDSTYSLGKDFEGYQYALVTSDEVKYASLKDYLMKSEDVTGYKESNVVAGLSIAKEYLSDEYIDSVKKVVARIKPGGVSEEEESYLYGDSMTSTMWMIILSDEEYLNLAKKAGADMAIASDTEKPSVLVYDTTSIVTDNYRYAFKENGPMDYAMYRFRNPLKVGVGETLRIDSFRHDPENAADYSGEAVVAGYISESQLDDLYKVDDSELWCVTTMANAFKLLNVEEELDLARYFMAFSAMEFNVVSDDCAAMKMLEVNGSADDPNYVRASLLFGLGSYKEAIAAILKIVAVCFVVLIMLICTLNLYNSVMGRSIERRGELAVLRSVGMTDAQMKKMLHLENVKLFLGSIGWSALISTAFVYFLHRAAENIIGRMTFSFPYVIIIGVCILEIVLLAAMTAVCYGRDKTGLMERIRDESISG